MVTFHQTFSPLGSGKSVGVIWNESISGRNDGDLASVYIRFVSDLSNRDYVHIVIWADNCTAQNKNWTLYTTLCRHMNLSSTDLKSITIKYFETGHTFMSADSFHHRIKEELRRKKNVEDFPEFKSVIDSRGTSIMLCTEFPYFKAHVTKSKSATYPKLNKIKEV